MRSVGAALLIVLATVFAGSTACASKASEQQPIPSTDAPVITGEPAGFDADDIAFANNTMTHHRQSVELAALVPDHSSDPDLVALAANISAEQQPELELMRVLLVQWNENPDAKKGPGGPGGDLEVSLSGMIDDATVTRLQSSSGQEFDTLWLQSMIGHQQGQVALANAEIADGANVDAVTTAKRMVDSARAQIAQMQQMLDAG